MFDEFEAISHQIQWLSDRRQGVHDLVEEPPAGTYAVRGRALGGLDARPFGSDSRRHGQRRGTAGLWPDLDVHRGRQLRLRSKPHM